MALNIKINFEERYDVCPVDALGFSVFDTELKTGQSIRLGIKISSNKHPLMSEVYNLAFGPINAGHQIDDQAKLTHLNHSKVFSTIVFEGYSFLIKHPDKFLGIDGSDTARAYLYYRCIQNNFDYLANYFDIYGVNYYMRMFRDHSTDYETDDFLTIPKAVEKGEVINPAKLYNYFIFKAKQPIVNKINTK